MNSIKKKLFLYIGLLTVFFIGLTIAANSLLLEPYYIRKQQEWLIMAFEKIAEEEATGYNRHFFDSILIDNKQKVDIVIMDENENIIFGTTEYIGNSLSHPNNNVPSPKEIDVEILKIANNPNYDIYKEEIYDENIRFYWFDDNLLGAKNLSLAGTLDNGYYIEFRIALVAINVNIALYNNFSLIIGIVIFSISILIAYLISNNFTRPIIEISKITGELKRLNFDNKCHIRSKDEIGQLAENVNELSNALAHNLEILYYKNEALEKEIEIKTKLDMRRKELLNNVSHELKSPLSLMLGYAEALKLNISTNKEDSDFFCDVIMDEASKMNQLVEKLLNINQVEFGDISLSSSEFEVNEFIEGIVKKHYKVIEDNDINFQLTKTMPMTVIGDEIMLESVFTNYLNNGINYIDSQKRLRVGIHNMDSKALVEVFNTSDPLSEDDIANIWTSFYKVDKARSRDKGGHGLGLSIVKAIQVAHQNNFGVKNCHEGVCFWFEIKKASL